MRVAICEYLLIFVGIDQPASRASDRKVSGIVFSEGR
jgi:hypothetical protein